MKRPHLLVMRQLGVRHTDRLLYRIPGHFPGDQCRKVSTCISNQHHLRGARQILQDLFFDRFRRNIMSRPQNHQALDAPNDSPVPGLIHFSLIAGMEPSVPYHFRGFFWTVPVSRKDVWPARHDLLVLPQPHLDARDRWPHPARHNFTVRIIHGADRRCLR